MKKQLVFSAMLFCIVGAFAQNNQSALTASKQQLSKAKSYNIALVWQDKQETDRNPGIRKEVLNIFPELANKELNQKILILPFKFWWLNLKSLQKKILLQ